jgi:hypothetical protein
VGGRNKDLPFYMTQFVMQRFLIQNDSSTLIDKPKRLCFFMCHVNFYPFSAKDTTRTC